MKKSFIILAIAIVLLAVGIGGYLVLRQDNDTQTATSSSTSSSQNSTQQAAATITYSGSGFTPSVTTVKSGDTVAITNTSSANLQFESDPHPQHTDDTDLNVGLVTAGQTKTFTVTKSGTHGFHNHFNSSQKGTITIQ